MIYCGCSSENMENLYMQTVVARFEIGLLKFHVHTGITQVVSNVSVCVCVCRRSQAPSTISSLLNSSSPDNGVSKCLSFGFGAGLTNVHSFIQSVNTSIFSSNSTSRLVSFACLYHCFGMATIPQVERLYTHLESAN